MEKIVLVTGTFNICHSGHIRLIEYASTFGKVIVGINSDPYLWKKYGKDKTIPLSQRAYVLSSIKFVDKVVMFTEEHPGKLIESLKPDFYVKGPDYKNIAIPELFSVEQVNCKLIIQNIEKENSTSILINI
jgi:D-beta-D-heptose 7-phosphate kinase/D-beta-D-heptose 1-phosphate adenosyltransferase